MNTEPFLVELVKLLDVPPAELVLDAELAGFSNWDSLTKVSLVGFVNEHYGLSMSGTVLDRAETVGQLLAVLTQLAPATV